MGVRPKEGLVKIQWPEWGLYRIRMGFGKPARSTVGLYRIGLGISMLFFRHRNRPGQKVQNLIDGHLTGSELTTPVRIVIIETDVIATTKLFGVNMDSPPGSPVDAGKTVTPAAVMYLRITRWNVFDGHSNRICAQLDPFDLSQTIVLGKVKKRWLTPS